MLSPVHQVGKRSYWIVPGTRDHLMELWHNMRSGDRKEVEASGRTGKKVLWRTFRNSIMCKTALIDGKVAAMWGLCAGLRDDVSLLSRLGVPWLLTTPIVESLPVTFVKVGRAEVAAMRALCPELESHVAAEYTQAIGMLKLMGFSVDKAEPIGKNGVMFCRFHLGRETKAQVI